MNGQIVVISGPSGVGKGTVCHAIRQSLDVVPSISMTTRAPRPQEQNGVDYFFVDRPTFQQHIDKGNMLEWAEYNHNLYGTPRHGVEEPVKQGKHVLLEIDPVGSLNVKRLFPQALLIFLSPPSLETLKQRLVHRQTNTNADIENRLKISEQELAQSKQFDHVVVNDRLQSCIDEVKTLIESFLNRKSHE
jgi:guanylate kinase